MLNGKRITIIVAFIAAIGGGLWVWVEQQGGFAGLTLKPDFTFEASPLAPALDYTKPKAWGAYPKKESYTNLRPAGEAAAAAGRREAVDVFFIHPTSLLSNERWTDDPTREDAPLNFAIFAGQASAFNQCCQIYAPRYRQATLWAFIGEDESPYKALELSYSDVLRAFRRFVKVSGNRPFILAAHSQGSLHGMRLLQEEIATNKRLAARMVAAYLVGYSIPTDMGVKIKPCKLPTSIRCYINWNSVLEEYDAGFWNKTGRLWLDKRWQNMEGKRLTCVNPLSWRLDGGLVSKKFHPGGLFVKSFTDKPSALTKQIVSARCSAEGLLVISPPPEDSYATDLFIGDGNDFHVYDYQLFYQSVRLNVEQRIKSFFKKSSRR